MTARDAYNQIRNAPTGVPLAEIPVPAAKALMGRHAIYVSHELGRYFATAETGDAPE